MHRLSLDSPPDLQLNNVSFTFYLDKDGTTRIADAHLADTIRGSCPKCGKQNKLFWFVWDNEVRGCFDEQGEEMSSITRRYFFCCPDCLWHYTDWGEWHDTRDSSEGYIFSARTCDVKGDHLADRSESLRIQREFWKILHERSEEHEVETGFSSDQKHPRGRRP